MTFMERRFIEDQTIAFARFCDREGLTHEQAVELAETLGDKLVQAADDMGLTAA